MYGGAIPDRFSSKRLVTGGCLGLGVGVARRRAGSGSSVVESAAVGRKIRACVRCRSWRRGLEPAALVVILVDQMFASWNQLASWLRQIDGLR